MAILFLGWVVIAAVWLVAQQRFYDIHWLHHGAWRPKLERWAWPPFPFDDYRTMLRATFTRVSIPEVERARQRYLLVIAIALVYLLASPFVFVLSN